MGMASRPYMNSIGIAAISVGWRGSRHRFSLDPAASSGASTTQPRLLGCQQLFRRKTVNVLGHAMPTKNLTPAALGIL
jgi:hypothetical protein